MVSNSGGPAGCGGALATGLRRAPPLRGAGPGAARGGGGAEERVVATPLPGSPAGRWMSSIIHSPRCLRLPR